MLEVERGVDHVDKITVKSDVDQTVYMSAYVYDTQHTRNGGCADYMGDSSAWMISSDIDNEWYYFLHGDAHYKAVEMKAGQQIDLDIYIKFTKENLLPSDYSFVAWASESPVTIDVQHDHDHGESVVFPTYQLSDSVNLYDFNGNLIDGEGEFTRDREILSRAEWQLHNSDWRKTERNNLEAKCTGESPVITSRSRGNRLM